MPEQADNIWAPWRMEYVRQLHKPDGDACFLCEYAAQPANDLENHVLWRTPRSLVVFNRFPYSNGHMLIASTAHKAGLSELDGDERLEMMNLIADVQTVLEHAIHPQGFNVGFNFGRCAGAGLPDHVHAHVVPRWNGDTNFMSVVSDVRVILQSIDSLHVELRRVSKELGLPRGGK